MWLAPAPYVLSLASRRPRRLAVIAKRYVLRRLIGRGGMGRVYEAWDRREQRMVAVKMIHESLANDADVIHRFGNEVLALRSVDHPNVVAFRDTGLHFGAPYLVMELLEGPSLERHVAEHGPLDVDTALRVFCQAARGLAALHEAKIVHRDAKPSNLMLELDEKGKPVGATWSDLGLARVRARKITAAGIAVGTGAYMAPEQVVGEDVGPRSDLYGLAISLFFALTGQLPFDTDARRSMLLQLASAAPPLSWLLDDVDESVERIVATGLRKNPRHRYPTALAMLADMERALGEREGPVSGAPARGPDRFCPGSGRAWRLYARACSELRICQAQDVTELRM